LTQVAIKQLLTILNYFTTFATPSVTILTAAGSTSINKIGEMFFFAKMGNDGWTKIHLDNVAFLPSANANLLGINALNTAAQTTLIF